MLVFDFFDGCSRELIDALAEHFDINQEELVTFLLEDEATAFLMMP